MKKIIASSVLATLAVAGISGIAANADTESLKEGVFNKGSFERNFEGKRGWNKWERMSKMFLTTEEREEVKDMTKEEKKEFMKTKKEEFKNMTDEQKAELKEKMVAEKESMKLKREAKDAVIDSLLAWKTLTSEQETLKEEIIKERAEKKANRLERKSKMEEIKTILEKKKSWEDLTEEEETKLKEMKSDRKRWKKCGKWERGNRGGHR